MTGRKTIIFALSYAPPPFTQLVTTNNEGVCHIWDTTTGRMEGEFKHHSQSAYRVHWNPNDPNLILSSSMDKTAVVFKPNGQVAMTCKHPAGVFGVRWSPFNAQVFATACADGRIRVYSMV